MIDTLPERKLQPEEMDKSQSIDRQVHAVITNHSDETSGLLIEAEDSERGHFILWSPREEEWAHHETAEIGLDTDEQAGIIQEFIDEHYPEDAPLHSKSSQ